MSSSSAAAEGKGAGSHTLAAPTNTDCGGDRRDGDIRSGVWYVLERAHTQAPGSTAVLSSQCSDILPKPVLRVHWCKKPSWCEGFTLCPTKQNVRQPWREILSPLPGNVPCSLACKAGMRTPSFPCSGGRPVESILQMLWHPVLDVSYRAWGSWEALSWPSASIFLLHLNVQTGMAVMGLYSVLFRGTPRTHCTC